jgi:hypothetical protein
MNSLKSEVKAVFETLGSVQSRTPVTAESGGQRLACEMVALDTLACAFDHFNVESAALAAAPLSKLKLVAEDLSRRLTYLLEPITPVELDADQCVVQLRSNPPQKDDNSTTYYELLVKQGGRLSLDRYTKERTGDRQRVPTHVTREVFLRLADDFSKASALDASGGRLYVRLGEADLKESFPRACKP